MPQAGIDTLLQRAQCWARCLPLWLAMCFLLPAPAHAADMNKTVRFAEAPVKGMSVLKYDPDGKAAYAYRQLAEEVLANGKR